MPSNPVEEARCIAETDDDEFLVGQTVYRCQLPDGHDGPHKWSRPSGALIMWEASVVTQARIREEGREQERSRYEGLLAIVGAVARADNDDYIGEIKVDIPAGGYPRQSLLTAARAVLGEEQPTDA